jgi:ketosteroid isomerase-like protein
MSRNLFLSWIALLALAAACCHLRIDPVAARAELKESDRAFARDTAERGVEGWVAWFDEEGVMLPAGSSLTRGREAIRDLMTPAFADPAVILHWGPTEARVSRSGDLGYTLGWYELRRRADEETVTLKRGKYVTIWRKQADGSWKVIVDAGTEDAAPAPAPGDPS